VGRVLNDGLDVDQRTLLRGGHEVMNRVLLDRFRVIVDEEPKVNAAGFGIPRLGWMHLCRLQLPSRLGHWVWRVVPSWDRALVVLRNLIAPLLHLGAVEELASATDNLSKGLHETVLLRNAVVVRREDLPSPRKPLQLPAVLGRWSVESAGDWALGVLGHSVGAKTSGSANSHGGLTSILNGLVVVVGSIGGGGSASDSLGRANNLTRLGEVVRDWVGRWDAVVVRGPDVLVFESSALRGGARSRQEQSDDDGGNKLAVHHVVVVAVRVLFVVVVVAVFLSQWCSARL